MKNFSNAYACIIQQGMDSFTFFQRKKIFNQQSMLIIE